MASLIPDPFDALFQLQQTLDQLRSSDWLGSGPSGGGAYPPLNLFRKGDDSEAMFYTLTGRFRLNEIALDIAPGQVVGEIGLIAPDNKRTLTFECIEDGDLLTISYEHVKELYFQNPQFGFYFLELVSKKLFKDIERLQPRAAHPT